MCMYKSVCVHEHFVYSMRVPWRFFSCRWCSDDNWKAFYCHSTPYYLVAFKGGTVCVFWCLFCEHTLTQTNTQYVQAHPSSAGICLPPTWLSLSITPNARPALHSAGEHLQLRSQPRLPAPSAALKLHSVLWMPTLHFFLIICLHHRVHFHSTHRFSGFEWIILSCPEGTSQNSDPPALGLPVKSTYVLHLCG